MLLHNRKRKLQTGGSLNLAKNEPAPIDIRWKQFDTSLYKQKSLDIPTSMMNNGLGTKTGVLGGLPSDIQYAKGQLDYYKNKIKQGLSGPNSADYGDTEAKKDSDQVTKWSESLMMLKSMEDNYKTTKTKAIKASNNYAIENGKAFAINNETGKYEIIDSQDILTERIRNGNGKLIPKYIPATISQALTVRLSDPEFSGFIDETGGVLDQILAGTQSTEDLDKDMNAMFAKVGFINEEQNTFTHGTTGVSMSLDELLTNLQEASTIYANGSTKTNKGNLEAAVQTFSQNMSPAQKEALQAKAIVEFIGLYGNREVARPEAAMDWVNAKVASDIATRAAAFLKISVASTKKGTSAKTGSSGSEATVKELPMSKIGLARAGGEGKPVTLEVNKWTEAEDLTGKLNNLAYVDATPIPLSGDFLESGKALPTKTRSTIAANPLIRKLTEDNLNGNLFLADAKSTPLASLAGGRGLERSAVNTTANGGQSYVLRSMPYVEENGQYKIAWEFVDKLQAWNKKYWELEADRLSKQKVTSLSREERAEIIAETSALMGYDIDKLGDDVKVGDILMLPVIVYDTDKSIDDPDLDSYMQGNVTGSEMDLIDNAIGGKLDLNKNIKRTYAFTVLSNNPDAMLNAYHYGTELALKDKVNIKFLEESLKNAQRVYKRGYDVLDMLSDNAISNPTK